MLLYIVRRAAVSVMVKYSEVHTLAVTAHMIMI